MYQIGFWLRLHPRPHWRSYSAPPDPQSGFMGPTYEGREGGGEGRGDRASFLDHFMHWENTWHYTKPRCLVHLIDQ